MTPWAVLKNLSVKGFEELEISPLLSEHYRGKSVPLTCIIGAVHKGLCEKDIWSLTVTLVGAD